MLLQSSDCSVCYRSNSCKHFGLVWISILKWHDCFYCYYLLSNNRLKSQFVLHRVNFLRVLNNPSPCVSRWRTEANYFWQGNEFFCLLLGKQTHLFRLFAYVLWFAIIQAIASLDESILLLVYVQFLTCFNAISEYCQPLSINSFY